jgi:hypothetical protein
MITPTARSTTLPRIANCLNSFIIDIVISPGYRTSQGMIPQALFIGAHRVDGTRRCHFAGVHAPGMPGHAVSLGNRHCGTPAPGSDFVSFRTPSGSLEGTHIPLLLHTQYFFSNKHCHSHIILCCCKLLIDSQVS